MSCTRVYKYACFVCVCMTQCQCLHDPVGMIVITHSRHRKTAEKALQATQTNKTGVRVTEKGIRN